MMQLAVVLLLSALLPCFTQSLNANKVHIVLLGNPGVGKSFILNTLLGEIKFKSGVSIGSGLTTTADSHETSDFIYTDTPGLDDVHRRDAAADQISQALTDGGEIKLIFVCTLQSGRLRRSDLATTKIVLEAFEDAGVDTTDRYSVLVNKCSDNEMKTFENTLQRAKIRYEFARFRSLRYIEFFPIFPEADDIEDYLLSNAGGFVKFVDNAPTITVPRNTAIRLNASTFEQIIKELEKEEAELRLALEARKAMRAKEEQRYFIAGLTTAVVIIVSLLMFLRSRLSANNVVPVPFQNVPGRNRTEQIPVNQEVRTVRIRQARTENRPEDENFTRNVVEKHEGSCEADTVVQSDKEEREIYEPTVKRTEQQQNGSDSYTTEVKKGRVGGVHYDSDSSRR